jgi:hypothetical protein
MSIDSRVTMKLKDESKRRQKHDSLSFQINDEEINTTVI